MTGEKEKIYLEYMVLHCQHGDSAAWREMVKMYEKRLFYYIKQIVGSREDALNILQETWLKAYRSISKLREPASLTPWLYRIAHNAALKFLRSHRYALSLDEVVEPEVNNQNGNDQRYSAEEIHKGLQVLKLVQRETLMLFYLEDFSMQQIAEILQVPVGTVRSRLHYARQSLKAVLEKETENECK